MSEQEVDLAQPRVALRLAAVLAARPEDADFGESGSRSAAVAWVLKDAIAEHGIEKVLLIAVLMLAERV